MGPWSRREERAAESTWFSMDLVDGPAVPGEGMLGADKLRAVLEPLSDTLGYLNGLGQVHGDLKPDNPRREGDGFQEALTEALDLTGAERIFYVAKVGYRDLPAESLFSRSICNWVLADREPVRLLDAQDMEGWKQQQSILALGLRTIVAVPVIHAGDVVGVCYVDSSNIMTTLGTREQGLLELPPH